MTIETKDTNDKQEREMTSNRPSAEEQMLFNCVPHRLFSTISLAAHAHVASRDAHPSPATEPCSSHVVQLEVHVTPYIPAPHNGHGGVTKLVGGVARLLPFLPQHTTELLEATMPQE